MNRKGQALVEFILILPIFIVILFAIVDFGTILNKKSELENTSSDIVNMLKNNSSINDIKNIYSKLDISLEKDEKYTKILITEDINIMTPGLNLVLGNPYEVKVERVIPNV